MNINFDIKTTVEKNSSGLEKVKYTPIFEFKNNETTETATQNKTSATEKTYGTPSGSIYSDSETAGSVAYNYFCPSVNFSAPCASAGTTSTASCSAPATSACTAA